MLVVLVLYSLLHMYLDGNILPVWSGI